MYIFIYKLVWANCIACVLFHDCMKYNYNYIYILRERDIDTDVDIDI